MAEESDRATVEAEAEARELEALAQKPFLSRLATYARKSGPGWLQGAITLGGGSLSGALYLGVLGGYAFLWLQPLAMLLGVIMLSSIAYVTLSTGQRPFRAINEHVNPALGWGWALATLAANIVWCLPQFALGTAAVQQNLIPALSGILGTVVTCAVLLGIAIVVVWFYDSGARGIRVFEWILKGMVALIVLCFAGVVIRLAFSPGGLPWGRLLRGLIPNVALAWRPPATYDQALAATGKFAEFWTSRIVHMQRDVMITAAATAVGINMTFLLPYSMLRKGWRRAHRELAVVDLAIGLFLPFVLATGFVVIAAAHRFHATPEPGVLQGTAPPALMKQYRGLLAARVRAETGVDIPRAELDQRIQALPEADKRMAAMLVKRDAFNLAAALEKLTGRAFAQYVFGVGVLGMALSTIIILMLINGFTVCEMLGYEPTGWPHRIGCLIPALGVFGPFIWKHTKFWLAVPTSVFGMALLPIAYLTFFLMMNSASLLGDDRPRGRVRLVWNVLMLVALVLACIGAGYAIWSKVRWFGVAAVALYLAIIVVVHMLRRHRGTNAPAAAQA